MKKVFYSEWYGNIRYRILKFFGPKQFYLLPMDSKTNKSVRNSMCPEKSSASGVNGFLKNA